MYDSVTMTADMTGLQPNGVSKLCLSCHDGTVSLDSFGTATGGINFITGTALFGTDLSNDHPISFTYDAALALADLGLNDPTTAPSGIVAEIDDDMLFGVLNDQLECASCHDPHNGAGVAPMLLKDNAASALCTTCHNK
jgi:predicted CXXCH cytochrome family protein